LRGGKAGKFQFAWRERERVMGVTYFLADVAYVSRARALQKKTMGGWGGRILGKKARGGFAVEKGVVNGNIEKKSQKERKGRFPIRGEQPLGTTEQGLVRQLPGGQKRTRATHCGGGGLQGSGQKTKGNASDRVNVFGKIFL